MRISYQKTAGPGNPQFPLLLERNKKQTGVHGLASNRKTNNNQQQADNKAVLQCQEGPQLRWGAALQPLAARGNGESQRRSEDSALHGERRACDRTKSDLLSRSQPPGGGGGASRQRIGAFTIYLIFSFSTGRWRAWKRRYRDRRFWSRPKAVRESSAGAARA